MKLILPTLLISLFSLIFLQGCEEEKFFDPYPLDDVLRFNHIQAKGTHNSYHVEPEEPADDSHRYTHSPLDEQLSLYGVRQFELDLHYRKDEGFEVFHLPFLDDVTTCRKLVDCLGLIHNWSERNRGHIPILIWLEPKYEVDFLDSTLLDYIEGYDELEEEILSVFPRNRILAPDDVRGSYEDLPKAITNKGWPTLREIRGKVLFSLLDGGEHRDAYIADTPNLAGKLMFVNSSEETDPYAALFKINNAQTSSERVRQLVLDSFIVTSNVDGADNTEETNSEKLAASLEAGFHYGSSDFPAERSGYWFELPDGNPARCNPVFPVESCSSEDIENL